MLAWIGHRNKQYHLIYSSQPGLWLSVLNRGLPSTQWFTWLIPYLLNDQTFLWDNRVCLATALTWAIWVWSRKNTLCLINVLIMPILIDVKCSQSCYIHFLQSHCFTQYFKALYVCCRGEFFWHSWDITGVWESFWRVRWLL